jgi:ribosomal protein S13
MKYQTKRMLCYCFFVNTDIAAMFVLRRRLFFVVAEECELLREVKRYEGVRHGVGKEVGERLLEV